MAINQGDLSQFIVNPLSSFHTLLFVGVLSYFLRLAFSLNSQSSVLQHILALIIAIAIWLGLLLSTALLKPILNWLVPSLNLTISLDIQRHWLSIMNKLELIIGVSLLHLLEMQWSSPRFQLPFKLEELERFNLVLLIPIILVGFLQTCWLLPAILHRSMFLINADAGAPPTRDLNTTNTNNNNNEQQTNYNSTQLNNFNNNNTELRNYNFIRSEAPKPSFGYLIYLIVEYIKIGCLCYTLNLLVKVLGHYIIMVARN